MKILFILLAIAMNALGAVSCALEIGNGKEISLHAVYFLIYGLICLSTAAIIKTIEEKHKP